VGGEGLIVVAGRVAEGMVRIEGRELQMILATDESLGNCPKVCDPILNEFFFAYRSISRLGISRMKKEKE